MKTSLAIAAVFALLASPVLANAAAMATTAPKAKAVYCTDKVTHKRISCKTPAPMMAAKPATAAKPGKTHTAMAKGKPAGKKCGDSHIAADKTCHK